MTGRVNRLAIAAIGVVVAAPVPSPAEPAITGLVIDGPSLAVSVASPSNVTLTAETSSDLADWTSIATQHTTNNSSVIDDYPHTADPARFFRARTDPPGTVRAESYHGWADALHLSNEVVFATIVPGVARIMQFGFHGTDGVFWENRSLDGGVPDPNNTSWENFGGDKAWPAPQGDWPMIIGATWPPPGGFDAMPYRAFLSGGEVIIQSPKDPSYRIQVTRRIRLFPGEPRMRITTTFYQEKGREIGVMNTVGVWIVAQVKDPDRLFFPIPENSIFSNGINPLPGFQRPRVSFLNGLVSFTRDPGTSTKVGTDADPLLWIGPDACLEMSAPRIPGAVYPDGNSSAEIYTGAGSQAYVELELLGPLTELAGGESVSFSINYTLHRRVHDDPQQEAERILLNTEY